MWLSCRLAIVLLVFLAHMLGIYLFLKPRNVEPAKQADVAYINWIPGDGSTMGGNELIRDTGASSGVQNRIGGEQDALEVDSGEIDVQGNIPFEPKGQLFHEPQTAIQQRVRMPEQQISQAAAPQRQNMPATSSAVSQRNAARSAQQAPLRQPLEQAGDVNHTVPAAVPFVAVDTASTEEAEPEPLPHRRIEETHDSLVATTPPGLMASLNSLSVQRRQEQRSGSDLFATGEVAGDLSSGSRAGPGLPNQPIGSGGTEAGITASGPASSGSGAGAQRSAEVTLPVNLPSSQVRFQRRVAPIYPREAQMRNYQGKVVISLVIDRNGTAKQVSVYESSGYRILDDAGLVAARSSTYHPHMVNGQTVEVRSVVEYQFRLR